MMEKLEKSKRRMRRILERREDVVRGINKIHGKSETMKERNVDERKGAAGEREKDLGGRFSGLGKVYVKEERDGKML